MKCRRRMGQSMSLIVIFEYQGEKVLVSWQTLNKRYYEQFAHALVSPLRIAHKLGIILQANQPSIKILKGTEWKDIPVKEIGDTDTYRTMYFEGLDLCSTSSVITQVSSGEIYIIGGNQDYPSLVAREYEVNRSCIRVNIQSGVLALMASMGHGRWLHDTCAVGHYIFVVGGRTKTGR